MNEIEFNGYTIREDGTITNKDGSVKTPYGKGYDAVKLYYNGRYNQHYVHRLVAEAFIDGRDETVNHKDGNKRNNHVSNLEWMSYSDNNKHARENGLVDKIYEKKLPQPTRRKIATLYKTGKYKYTELAFLFSIDVRTVKKYIKEFL